MRRLEDGSLAHPPHVRWRHYRSPGGRKPVPDFIDSLVDRHATLVVDEMRKVRRADPSETKHLGGGIWEVKVSRARASYRVLFAKEGKHGQVLLSLAAFQKQTQKTPRATIELAKQRLADWRRRGVTRVPAQGRRGIER